MGLKDIVRIIEDLRSVTSTKSKEHILTKEKNNELLKKILWYTYNDNVYGVSKKTLDKMKYDPTDDKSKWNNLYLMLDELASSNINDNLRDNVRKHLNYYDEEIRDLIIRILLKDLKCGISAKTINKCIPGLIPTFNQMKSYSYDDKTKKTFDKKAEKVGYIQMIKDNGIKGIIIIEDGNVTIKTRQNKIVEGLVEIEEAFKGWEDGVYEGEFLAVGEFKTSKEQFKATDKIHSMKGIKKGLEIHLFDYIPLTDFSNGYSDMKAIDRKNYVKEKVKKHNHKLIKMIDVFYIGKDTSLIQSKLEIVSKEDYKEGLMVQLCDSKWEGGKKVKHTLKCKLWKCADLLCIGLKESKEQPNTLGSIILDFKGNEVSASGISDELKNIWWNNPSEVVGKIVEIKFKEITVDKNGVESLQFPNFVRIRYDKTIDDTNID